MDLTPFITVAVVLFIVMSLIWAIPIGLNIMQTRPTRTFKNIDREDRTEAAIFCYALSKEKVAEVKALITTPEKQVALAAEYMRLNPTHSPVQAEVVVKTYLEIYGAEVGMPDSILHSRAAMPTGALNADGVFVPFDFGSIAGSEPGHVASADSTASVSDGSSGSDGGSSGGD